MPSAEMLWTGTYMTCTISGLIPSVLHKSPKTENFSKNYKKKLNFFNNAIYNF